MKTRAWRAASLLLLFFLASCGDVKVYDNATGQPIRNYEVSIKTPDRNEPVAAQFHIVREYNKGKYQHEPEYYDLFKEDISLSPGDVERTQYMRMVLRVLNPTGQNLYNIQARVEGQEGSNSR